MLPKYHFLAGAILSMMFFPVLKWNSLIILASTVLIDVDHYWWHVLKSNFRDWSLKNAYNFCRKNQTPVMLIFHTVEFWIILGVGSFYSQYIFLVFIGVLLHISLDMIYDKMKKYSFIGWLIKK